MGPEEAQADSGEVLTGSRALLAKIHSGAVKTISDFKVALHDLREPKQKSGENHAAIKKRLIEALEADIEKELQKAAALARTAAAAGDTAEVQRAQREHAARFAAGADDDNDTETDGDGDEPTPSPTPEPEPEPEPE